MARAYHGLCARPARENAPDDEGSPRVMRVTAGPGLDRESGASRPGAVRRLPSPARHPPRAQGSPGGGLETPGAARRGSRRMSLTGTHVMLVIALVLTLVSTVLTFQ
jgi:hypothetical protein